MTLAGRDRCGWCKTNPHSCPWHDNPKPVVGVDFGRGENSTVSYLVQVERGVDEFIRELKSYGWPDYTLTGRRRPTREEEFRRMQQYAQVDSYNILKQARALRGDGPISSDLVGSNKEEKMNRRDVIEAQLRNLQRELAILERFPKMDTYADGTVIKFERVFGGSWEDMKDVDNVTKFSYAAIKVNGDWYLSGLRQPSGPMKWGKLVEWLGDGVGEIWLMVPDVRIVGDSDEAYPQQADSKLSLSDPAKAVYEITSPEADR